MKKRNKVLVVSWGVYPSTTGSGVIISNLAKEFSRQEMVLLGEKSNNYEGEGWSDHFPKIIYVDPNISIKGRGQKYFRWLNVNKIKNIIVDVATKENCNSILAIFPDDFYLYAAYSASQKLKVPFYSWFHNTYLDNYTGIRYLFARWLQPKIFEATIKTFVMSDGILEYYRCRYPNNSFATLIHGFKIPDLQTDFRSDYSGKIKFLFTGNLNDSCRDAAVRLIMAILKNPKYEVHIYSGNPIEHFSRYGISGKNVFYHGFIELDKLEGNFSEFDIMLLPHGFKGNRTQVEYDTIFPTRTIPLLYSNRPILAHTPKGAYLTKFLKETKCAAVIDTVDEVAIKQAIEKILENSSYRRTIVANAKKVARRFDIQRVSEQLRSALA